ncbi:palladin isoform X5 [Danio rerio]|uniref:Palladin n=2 Tax=Danio rerio TaxID=7955 RepID=A0A8M9PC71_DANRE
MQDGSWNDTLPLSLLMNEACPSGGVSLEGDGGAVSGLSLDGEVYMDTMAELESGDGDFPELSAFLSQDEINLSLDLAREAMSDVDDPNDPKPPVPTEHLPLYSETKDHALPDSASHSVDATSGKVASSQSRQNHLCAASESPEKFVCQKSIAPVYKQDRPRLIHGGLELNERAASATEFCSRAATFIEELSSIFKGSARVDPQGDEDSSSPDSGYLSPKSHRLAMQQAQPPSSSSSSSEPQQEGVLQGQADVGSGELQGGGVSLDGPVAPPRFTQKLKSQEVAEGSPIRLECRVTGNPLPLVRWFCEGRELHHCPDIQICRDGDLHTLVITEAFEDDTGRYTCVASNALGADNTSAEVYIEGASSSDSEGEGSVSKSRSGAMPQAQKKTSSVSLTIHTSSPKSPEAQPHRSTLVQPISTTPQRVQSPVSSLYAGDALAKAPPSFTKVLQDAQPSEGQVVVLECRVRGSLPLRVQWFREGQEIQDSPDFRILQKKPRSAAEPEEICTLVIAEAFPEDGGLFCCTATNEYGSVNSTAQLTVTPVAEEMPTNGVSGDESVFEDNQSFPPPPPPLPPPPPPIEISLLEVPPKTPPSAEAFQINELDIWPSVTALPVQVSTDKKPEESRPNKPLQNGQFTKPLDESLSSPSSVKETAAPPPSPSAVRAPPLPTKPKPKLSNEQADDVSNERNAVQLKQLQDQILLEQQQLPAPQEVSPPSPPLPPPPSFQELESSTMQTSTFNYARPKQFIAAQSPTTSGAPIGYSSQSSSSSPLSPTTSHKPFSRVSLPPFHQQPLLSKSSSVESPSSPSFPPPPPPFLSSSNLSSPAGLPQEFPLPPPPPPPPVTSSPTRSDTSSPFTSTPHSPAGFLASVLPTTPPPPPMNALGLPKGNGTVALPRKTTPRTPRIISDSDIQGSKDAVIQDLERKLRFKEERLSNGQQEYKVSSFEQRLISEIEFRLERSPVEESDDDVQHDEDAPGEVAPSFDQKLKHYKVFEGMPVTFSCKVMGDPKPKVYWFKDGKQISKRSEHYRISRDPDGTCSLHTTAASLDDDGNYTIMAGNPAGRVSCTGRMMVQAVNQRGRSQRSTPGHIRRPRSRSRDSGDENENIQERHFRPHFLQAPGDLIVQEGKLCRMDCKVSGLPTPDLIWQLNGQTIRPDSFHKMLVRENGVHSLVIEPVTSRDAGVYTCIASNRAGQNSFNLELIVAAKEMHKAPSFIEKLQNTSVAEGHPVRLECRVSGVPFPQIFWKKENESFTHNTDRISMHQDNFGYLCMIIQPALKEDAGWYTVSAKNEAGIISSTARLDVHAQWQQTHTPKLKKVRPSTSRYAALTERGLDVKAAFFPDSNPLPPGTLVESDDL